MADLTTLSMLDNLAELDPQTQAQPDEEHYVTLRNLHQMPVIGLGCGNRLTFRDEVVQFAYQKCGVRLYDVRSNIGTEEALRKALLDSKLCKDRRELFITTTLDPGDYHRVSAALEESLLNLGTDYVDLYLMNWPDVGCHEDNIEGRNRIWRQLEEHYQDGLCKAIGVANFCARQLRPLVNECMVYPHVAQVEMHPLNFDNYFLHFCRENGITVQAHTPYAQGGALAQPTVRRVATLYGRTSAQILSRWAIDRKVCLVPGATRRMHVIDNQRVWDFKLSPTDMKALNGLNSHVYATRDPRGV